MGARANVICSFRLRSLRICCRLTRQQLLLPTTPVLQERLHTVVEVHTVTHFPSPRSEGSTHASCSVVKRDLRSHDNLSECCPCIDFSQTSTPFVGNWQWRALCFSLRIHWALPAQPTSSHRGIGSTSGMSIEVDEAVLRLPVHARSECSQPRQHADASCD